MSVSNSSQYARSFGTNSVAWFLKAWAFGASVAILPTPSRFLCEMMICVACAQHVGSKRLIHQHQAVLSKLLWEVANAPDHLLPLEKRLVFCTVGLCQVHSSCNFYALISL
jgi:hypothetical protein